MFATALEDGMRTLKQDGIEKVLRASPTSTRCARSASSSAAPCRSGTQARRATPTDLFQRLDAARTRSASRSRSERDIDQLLESILVAAKNITQRRRRHALPHGRTSASSSSRSCATTRSASRWAARPASPIPFHPIALYDRDGEPVTSMVAAYAVHHDKSVNIADAYTEEGFDFSGTKSFDQKTGYRSRSFLTIPMKNHENEIIGVLQLINAKDRATGAVGAFSRRRPAARRVARLAGGDRAHQPAADQPASRTLFESFIKLINAAIDDKSPYTGGHCERVPMLTMLLADAVDACKVGPLQSFTMSDRDRYELKIAGLLHDCGKVTTPVHVVDKATKLQTIFDRIELDRHALRDRQARRGDRALPGASSPQARRRATGAALAALERRVRGAPARDRRRIASSCAAATSAASPCGRRTRSACGRSARVPLARRRAATKRALPDRRRSRRT